ncbi:coiled-coil domain-containing protein 144A-like [Sarcophilus harrisii]|uniref:coiled-coil domain-containing protein 144A-like n=1 Tax=Sarcophilus harrisii TaxID=9305 RepID=UPI001301EF21|nr:coiled-coil domain-containing protein 144A-like [Sarcophilus harrisii]
MKKCFNFCKKLRSSSSCFKLLSSFGVQTHYPTEGYLIRSKDLRKIHKAALRGDVEKVQQQLLLGKNNVNDLDKVKRTPLHLACANGYPDVVSLLIERKCELNLLDNDSRTPLMKAIECQQEECATILLEHGADPNLKDNKNNNALHHIASGQSKFMAEKLIKHNIDIEAKNQVEASLLYNKVDYQLKNQFLTLQEDLTPLLLAIIRNNIKMADILLKNGANVNALDNYKRTALMIAVSVESIDLVTLLLQNNADYTLQDIDGWTAETYAEQHGYPLHIYNKQIEEQWECHNSCPPQIGYAEKPSCSGFALGVSSLDKKLTVTSHFPGASTPGFLPGLCTCGQTPLVMLGFRVSLFAFFNCIEGLTTKESYAEDYINSLSDTPGPANHLPRTNNELDFDTEVKEKKPKHQYNETLKRKHGKNLTEKRRAGKQLFSMEINQHDKDEGNKIPGEEIPITSISSKGNLAPVHDVLKGSAKITLNENKDEVEMGTDTLDSFTLVTGTEDFSTSNYVQGASCLWEGQNRVLASELSVKCKNSRMVRFASKVLAFENIENCALQETFSESRITESQQKHQKVECENRFAKITVIGNKDKVEMCTDTFDNLTLDTDSCLWEDQNRVLAAQLTVNFKKSQQIKLTRDVMILENTGTYRLQETFSKSSITESQQKHQKVQCESRFAKIPVIGNNKDEVEMDKDTHDDFTQSHDTDTLLKSYLPVKYKKSQWKQLGRRVRRLEHSLKGLQEKLSERRKTKSPLRHQKVKCDRELYGDRLEGEKQNREKLQTEINYPNYPTCANSATFHQESQTIKLNFQQARDQWLLLKNQLIEKIDKLSSQLSKVEKEKNQLCETLKMTTLILEETQRKLKKNKDKIKELKYKNHILKKKSNRSFFTKESRQELTQMPREIHVLQQPFEDAQNEGVFKIQVSDDIQVKFNDRSNTLIASIKKQDHVEKERKKKEEEESADEYLHIMEQIYKNEQAREEGTIRKFQQVLRDSKNEPSMNSQLLTSHHQRVLEWKKQLQKELDEIKRKVCMQKFNNLSLINAKCFHSNTNFFYQYYNIYL